MHEQSQLFPICIEHIWQLLYSHKNEDFVDFWTKIWFCFNKVFLAHLWSEKLQKFWAAMYVKIKTKNLTYYLFIVWDRVSGDIHEVYVCVFSL